MGHYCKRCEQSSSVAYPYHSFNIQDKALGKISVEASVPKDRTVCFSLCNRCFKELLLRIVIDERMKELEEGFRQGFMSCIRSVQEIKKELEQYMNGKSNIIIDVLDILIKSITANMIRSNDELKREENVP